MARYVDADAFERAVMFSDDEDLQDVIYRLRDYPTADVVERKKGKWTEKEVIHAEEAKEVITEWQSCRCSVCGRYHTQPYMYYFDNPNYCDFCGVDMRKETEDERNN